MPRDANGVYTLPPSYHVQTGDTLLPVQHNPPFEDVAEALTNSLARDGRTVMTSDLQMGGNRVTGMDDGLNPGDAVNKSQLDGKLNKDGSNLITPAEKGAVRAAIGGDLLSGFRNKVINGDFEIWQRGVSFAGFAAGAYSADRWRLEGSFVGGTREVSRTLLPVGVGIPGSPTYSARIEASGRASGDVIISQRIEGVRTLAGKTATLTLYAKGTPGMVPVIRLSQVFGTGGVPSPQVIIQPDAAPVSAEWERFDYVVDVPSIAGRSLGADGNDYLSVSIGLPEGASAMVLDVARVSFVPGDATKEADPFSPRHISQEESLCKYYYERISIDPAYSNLRIAPVFANSATVAYSVMQFALKRVAPTFSIGGGSAIIGKGGSGAAVLSAYQTQNANKSMIGLNLTTTGLVSGEAGVLYINGSTFIELDAEL